MSSTVLRVLAVILALGAVAVGYLGYQAGSRPPKVAAEKPAERPPEPRGEAVVLAAREIPAGRTIAPEDLTLGHVPMRPVRAFGSDKLVLGKKPKFDIAAGEMVLSSHFPSHSPLALALQPGERAVAVKVDEAIGVGGFVEPGDEVDVLLFLRANEETGENSSGQVVLSSVRVLAFGNMLEPSTDSRDDRSDSPRQADKAESGVPSAIKKRDKPEPSGKKSRTAVLAIPEQETSKLMLAESSGSLRLALVGAKPDAPADENALSLGSSTAAAPQKQDDDRRYIVLRELTGGRRVERPKRAPTGGMAWGAILHGDTVERIRLR